MSILKLKVNYLNAENHEMTSTLARGEVLHTTYKGNLSVAAEGGRQMFWMRAGEGNNVIVDADMSQNVVLSLWHGRTDPAADMGDWGTTYEGAPLTAVLVHIKPDGYSLLQEDGSIVFLPYVGDMLHHDGVYYGDVSVEVV